MIERGFAGGDPERLRSLAEELVHLNVDLIVTSGSTATRPVKQATAAIPIVMTQDPDPVGNGFVSSLARPGGNITGLSNLNRELKQIEIAAGAAPYSNAIFQYSGCRGYRNGIPRGNQAGC